MNALFDDHHDDPEFGHRLLADEARDHGEVMLDRTQWRIASSNGWFSAFGKFKRSKLPQARPAVHDDLCPVVDEHGRTRHVFAADAPNELRLTDFTEHKPADDSLYLCTIKDAYSGRIVAYAIDSRMKSRLAAHALENAVGMCDVAGCVAHSDSGSQFRNRKMLRAHGSSAHDRIDGQSRLQWRQRSHESSFAPLQENVLAMVIWIERTYHPPPTTTGTPGRLTPIECETIMYTTVALAA